MAYFVFFKTYLYPEGKRQLFDQSRALLNFVCMFDVNRLHLLQI